MVAFACGEQPTGLTLPSLFRSLNRRGSPLERGIRSSRLTRSGRFRFHRTAHRADASLTLRSLNRRGSPLERGIRSFRLTRSGRFRFHRTAHRADASLTLRSLNRRGSPLERGIRSFRLTRSGRFRFHRTAHRADASLTPRLRHSSTGRGRRGHPHHSRARICWASRSPESYGPDRDNTAQTAPGTGGFPS